MPDEVKTPCKELTGMKAFSINSVTNNKEFKTGINVNWPCILVIKFCEH